MTPDAKLRMEVYQEGQRAYTNNFPCPYIDWRAGTWEKGRRAAEEYYEHLRREGRREAMSKRDIQEQLVNAAAPSLELMRAASDEIALLRTENMKFLGLLAKLGDAVEALDGTSVENEAIVDEYRELLK